VLIADDESREAMMSLMLMIIAPIIYNYTMLLLILKTHDDGKM